MIYSAVNEVGIEKLANVAVHDLAPGHSIAYVISSKVQIKELFDYSKNERSVYCSS